jgi:hypothetical protein
MSSNFVSWRREIRKAVVRSELEFSKAFSGPLDAVEEVAGFDRERKDTPETIIDAVFELFEITSKKWPASMEQAVYFRECIAGHLPRLCEADLAVYYEKLRAKYHLPEPWQATCILSGRRRGKSTIVGIMIAICLIAMPRFVCMVFNSSQKLAEENYDTVKTKLEYIKEYLEQQKETTGLPPKFVFTERMTRSGHPEIRITRGKQTNRVTFQPSATTNARVRSFRGFEKDFSRCFFACREGEDKCKRGRLKQVNEMCNISVHRKKCVHSLYASARLGKKKDRPRPSAAWLIAAGRCSVCAIYY